MFVVAGLPGNTWFLTADFRLKSVLKTASLNGIVLNRNFAGGVLGDTKVCNRLGSVFDFK